MEAGPRSSDDHALEPGRTTRVHESGRAVDPVAGAPAEDVLAELPDDGAEELDAPGDGGESYAELRPPRRLRIWQLAPIVGLAVLGSLMFAFPLAFEFGDGGAVVAMLGLLITGCAAGWGMMATRRAGAAWFGLPPRHSGRRAQWRVTVLYALVCGTLVALAVWRVARLR
ncbi:hypothetical protein V1J52_00145 [Streptomyces sp. TRM 70351]|uniref:hypothetical protein n=1 Tax=Streptomyces sp. TRM 70351 TaxID=3116552 RepID=UPI002E7BB41B|nr:hypothetical protein [Streptomyces sp. TRM 70351]MEE1926605.1 hypothetical protein [Streptomyces sp. TRM 70351]